MTRPSVSEAGTACPPRVATSAPRKRTAPAAAGSGRIWGWCSDQVRWVSWVRGAMSVPPETEGGGGEGVLGVKLSAPLCGEVAGEGGGLALFVGQAAGGEGFNGGDG